MRYSPFKHRKVGFSLIEILVAMTILSVIVLIVAGIFQQTGLAWTLGLKRADAQSVTRAVIGAVSRDLAMMVDPCNFVATDATLQSQALSAEGLGSKGTTKGGLDFWILRPNTDASLDASKIPTRQLVHITYSGSSGTITRTEQPLGESEKRSTYNVGNGSLDFSNLAASIPSDVFSSFYDEPGVKVTVKPVTPASINDFDIAVASCGPDGEWGTDDDIRPWVDGEDK